MEMSTISKRNDRNYKSTLQAKELSKLTSVTLFFCQYTCAKFISKQKVRARPACTMSIPTKASSGQPTERNELSPSFLTELQTIGCRVVDPLN